MLIVIKAFATSIIYCVLGTSAIFVFVCVFIALKGHSCYDTAIFNLQVILLLQSVLTQIAQWFGWRSQKLVFKMAAMVAILDFQSA